MVSRETCGHGHFFDLASLWFQTLFDQVDYPWELLRKDLKEEWIRKHLRPNTGKIKREGGLVTSAVRLKVEGGEAQIEAGSFLVGDEIELKAGVRIEGGAWVTGPTILGPGTEVRHGAYVRGGVLTGEAAVIGHTTDVKSSIFLNKAKAAHFAYVGDSILGNHVNLGAGTKVSNLKITNDEVVLQVGGEAVRTGLRKMGSVVGDGTETGCNSVLNPGVLLGRKCLVYPAIAVRRNYYKQGSVIR